MLGSQEPPGVSKAAEGLSWSSRTKESGTTSHDHRHASLSYLLGALAAPPSPPPRSLAPRSPRRRKSPGLPTPSTSPERTQGPQSPGSMGPRSIPGVGERGGEGLASVGAPPPQRSECCPFASLTIRSILVSEVGDKLPRSFTLELRERAFSETSSLVGVFHAWFSSRESAPFSSTAAAERQKEERSHGGSVLVAKAQDLAQDPRKTQSFISPPPFPCFLGALALLLDLPPMMASLPPPLAPGSFRFRCRLRLFRAAQKSTHECYSRLGGENVQKNLKILTLGKVWRHFPFGNIGIRF